MKKAMIITSSLFVLLEAVLFYFIIFGKNYVAEISYISIVLCFLFSLLFFKKSDKLIMVGLLLTCGADYFLVLCPPAERLKGMIFFMAAQLVYGLRAHLLNRNKLLIILRAVLSVIGAVITVAILKKNTDALSVISVVYYANLVMNIICAFCHMRSSYILPFAFLMFLGCDTVIGLNVMGEGYINITEGSLVYNIIHCGFNLAWVFYLPSQVMIALSGKEKFRRLV